MFTTVAMLTAFALMQETDTTIPVTAGARLEVNNFGGEIAVKTWTRSAVRITASHGSRERISVDVSDRVVRVKSEGRRGPPHLVDYDITVPAAMALALSGVYSDISVQGSQGEISVETVQGSVKVSGGVGNVSLKSVQGDVTLENARGRIDLSSVNETIEARRISGDLTAETVNGDITLEQIESANTEASTVNGNVIYDGTIKDGGRYRFSTHDGDMHIAVPEGANVATFVSTFNGDFSACFPVRVTEKTKHRFSFTIGSGTARLEVESFNGDIRLCRPGHLAKDRDEDRHKNKDKDDDNEEE
jgi:DUF4097 and DUF4098 domain-containing protein YvlB